MKDPVLKARIYLTTPRMGQRKYPPLTQSEVVAILKSLGFTLAREESSHAHYLGLASGDFPRSIVTVDTGYREFDESRIKTMIRQFESHAGNVLRRDEGNGQESIRHVHKVGANDGAGIEALVFSNSTGLALLRTPVTY